MNVGVRCLEGASWTTFISAQIRVFLPALVAKYNLPYGSPVTEADVDLVESEISKAPGIAVSDIAQLSGLILARGVSQGAVLRTEYFKQSPVVTQGDMVKLVAKGQGFAITTEGEALTHALDGQVVRVRTDGGRIVSGLARAGRVVEVRY